MRQSIRQFGILTAAIIAIFALIACSGGAPEQAAPAQSTSAQAAAPAAAPTTAPAPTSPPAAAPQAMQPMAEPVAIVSTTNFVADWARHVGGDRVNVHSLLPVGGDPHTFQPGAKDVAAVADAEMVLIVGLGLEENWLHELLENAARDESSIIELATTVDPLPFREIGGGHDAHDDHDEHDDHDDHDEHGEDESLVEDLLHIVHEAMSGEISEEEGLMEIREAIAMMEEHGHEEEGMHVEDMVLDIIHQSEAGQMDAHGAIEEIDHLLHDLEGSVSGEDEHLVEDILHIIHEAMSGEISDDEGLMEIEEAIAMMGEHGDGHGHGHEEEKGEHVEDMVLAIIEQAEAGQMDAHGAIEEIDHLLHDLEGSEHGEDDHDDHDEDKEEDGHAGHDHHGHAHGEFDPHFWFDPLRVMQVVNDIAARLSVLDPDGRDIYAANAAAYNAELDELHHWTEEQVAAVPHDRRYLVTSHDSYAYFAELYGFEVVGAVIPSLTTDAEPSPADLAELTHTIEDYGVPAIFGETTVSDRLAQSVAAESGADLVPLYSGSLGGEGSGADTYIGMVRTNVERITGALK